MNFSEFIIKRLRECGVDHIFGIPGDYILPFFDTLMLASGVTHIGSTNELAAVHAADGFARSRGLGAAVVTYGPGALNGVNAIAAAYSENVPVVFISGAPNTIADTETRLYHHVIKNDLDKSLRIFAEITATSIRIESATTACEQFDRAFQLAISQKLPVYIEIPYDLQLAEIGSADTLPAPTISASAMSALPTPAATAHSREAARAIVQLLEQAKQPAIIPGMLVERFALQQELYETLQKTAIAFATVFDAKAGYLEPLSNCAGFYQGAMTPSSTRTAIESADVLILLGAELNEFNSGMFTSNVRAASVVRIGLDFVAINEQVYANTRFDEVWKALRGDLLKLAPTDYRAEDTFEFSPNTPYVPEPARAICIDRLYHRLSHYFKEGDVVAGDAGAYVNLTRVRFPAKTTIIGNGNWGSLGHGFAASVGYVFAGNGTCRVIGVIGDGSFQMTGQEFSNLVRFNKNYTLIVLNNKGYTAERAIQPEIESSYNDIQDWRYHLLNEYMGGPVTDNGLEVHTEGDLETALAEAERRTGPFVINVHLGKLDIASFNAEMSQAMKH